MKKELQEALARRIPLTLAMGLTVEEAGPDLVRLSFPLEPNVNHKGTAFGGSLYSAAVLAPWGLLWCALKRRGIAAQVVVVTSGERFIHPVDGPFIAECAAPDGLLEHPLRVLRRMGRARVDAESEIRCGKRRCLVFGGTYGLIRKLP